MQQKFDSYYYSSTEQFEIDFIGVYDIFLTKNFYYIGKPSLRLLIHLEDNLFFISDSKNCSIYEFLDKPRLIKSSEMVMLVLGDYSKEEKRIICIQNRNVNVIVMNTNLEVEYTDTFEENNCKISIKAVRNNRVIVGLLQKIVVRDYKRKETIYEIDFDFYFRLIKRNDDIFLANNEKEQTFCYQFEKEKFKCQMSTNLLC